MDVKNIILAGILTEVLPRNIHGQGIDCNSLSMSFKDRVLVIATSYAILAFLTNIPQICIDEKRPEFFGHN